MKNTRILITGRVQGVLFRVSARRKAEELGIRGTVTNLDTGQVEIICHGERLEEFITWCRRGPLLARVDDMETEEIVGRRFDSFEILR